MNKTYTAIYTYVFIDNSYIKNHFCKHMQHEALEEENMCFLETLYFFLGSMCNFGGVRGEILVTCVTDFSVGGESRLREDIMKVHESCRFKSVS